MPDAGRARRLKYVHRPDDIHLRPEHWIGPAKRHLKRREVDDVRDPVGLDGLYHLCGVREITADVRDGFLLLSGKQQVDPMPGLAEIKAHGPVAGMNEVPEGPRANTTHGASHEVGRGVQRNVYGVTCKVKRKTP